MRILWINHYAVPERAAAGTRHAVLARFLGDLGHEVTVVASSLPDGRRPTVDLPTGASHRDVIEGGVRFRYVRTSPYASLPGRLRSMIEFRSGVLRCSWDDPRPDVVIGSSVHLHAADAGRRLARRLGVPFVFEVRDLWPDTLVDIGAVSRLHPIYMYLKYLELRLYRDASAVITLLPGMAAYLMAHGIPEDRIWYVPNGVDPDLFPESPPPPSDSLFTVSYFGAHGPANGLETVIRAAAILRSRGAPVRFRLVGDGNRKPALRDLATSLGLDNVAFLDPVPKRDLAPLAAESHAFVFHLRDMAVLRKYGISANKLFDYLLAGRPVVFACASANDPVAQAGAGPSVPPEDPEALAGAIQRLMEAPESERAAMGRRGRAFVREFHDMRRLARGLADRIGTLPRRP